MVVGKRDQRMRSAFVGKVYLIGAGPGDPELLTLKALNLLKKADIVLYDSLLNEDILECTPESCKNVFVGKRFGRHSLLQSQVNELLFKHAKESKIVVRLKGGDPFIFGRGGEELDFLNQKNIEVEVIPGVTTASAVSASLKVPLTHRELGQSVLFLSGYGKNPSHGHLPDYDWNFLANASLTLVFYMALRNMSQIAEKLIAHGKPPDTGAAVISNCTLPNERILITTLSKLGNDAEKISIKFPTILLVGDVVNITKSTDTKTHEMNQKSDLEIPVKVKEKNKLLLLLFHGAKTLKYSTIPENLVKELKKKTNHAQIKYAFLTPSIEPSWESVMKESSKEKTIKQVDVFPIFLLPGKHLDEDIPNQISIFKKEYQNWEINLRPAPHIIKDMLPVLTKLSKNILRE